MTDHIQLRYVSILDNAPIMIQHSILKSLISDFDDFQIRKLDQHPTYGKILRSLPSNYKVRDKLLTDILDNYYPLHKLLVDEELRIIDQRESNYIFPKEDAVKTAWISTTKDSDGGSLDLYMDSDGMFHLREEHERRGYQPFFCRLWEVISSQLLLYRILCTFPRVHVETIHIDRKKQAWEVTLKHRSLNRTVTIADYKGTVSVHAFLKDEKIVNKKRKLVTNEEFQNEVLTLMSYLCSTKGCIHPYDETVAGIQA